MIWSLPFWAFGVVWVVFPERVLQFYKWFHPDSSHVQQTEPRHIRNAGLLWLAMMVVITYAEWGR
jgi:hypothetical protein